MTWGKCEDCRWWVDAKRKGRDTRYMFSLSSTYTRKLGSCDNQKCSEETLGYTGLPQGHKMSRVGNIERYCKFFEPKVTVSPNSKEETKEMLEKNLVEAYIKTEEKIDRVKVRKQQKILFNYMFLGSILQSLKKGKIFEKDQEPMLFWSDGTPISETHERLRVELDFNKGGNENE